MFKSRFTTLGRDIYPGREVKISCDIDVEHLHDGDLKDRYRLIYIKEGFGVFINGGNSQLITSPMILCLNESDVAEVRNSVGLTMDIMYFEPTCFERYVEFDSLEDWKSSLGDDLYFFRPFFDRSDGYIGACATNHYIGKRVSQLIALTNAELTEQRDHFWPCRSRSHFIELLLLTNSIYNEDEAYEKMYLGCMTEEISQVISWLHIHCNDKITMEDVTREFHTNKTTLNQKFKTVMGVTVMEYVINLRMQIVCSLLRKTYLSIKEIMERAGYRDDAHFLRSFKKYAGCTPSEYRSKYETS
ncbi:MAG: helix-turn-helix transcriptional regulator [Clostridiales bacterium]|jgi:AraC family L-rhamnose operon regulatory protein RhaS|nr:helix-turn-helix transcriptional regulator [Clostridiales bacterium]